MLFTLIYEIIMLMFYLWLAGMFICWVILPTIFFICKIAYEIFSVVGGAYLYTASLLKRIITRLKSGA